MTLTRGAFVGSGLATIAAAAPFAARAAEFADGGALLDANEFQQSPAALLPAMLSGLAVWNAPATLPASYVLPDLLPVSTQGTPPDHLGSPGSCEAQSFGYGLCGYTASRNADGSSRWNANDPAHAPSPAWLYSWAHAVTHKSCPAGSGATPYLRQMVTLGAPSVRDVPYRPICSYINPLHAKSVSEYPDAASLRIGSFATFQIQKIPPLARIAFMKAYLAAGHAIAFSGPVAKGYAHPALADGVFYAPGGFPGGGHGQVVVGYDDERGAPGKKGAFLVQNSFGTGWGDGGRLWWSYDTLVHSQKFASVAFPVMAPAGDGLLAESKVARDGTGRALVLVLSLGEPVNVARISVSGPHGSKLSLAYGAPLRSGVVALHSNEPFRSGAYHITLTGKTLGGYPYTKTSMVSLA